MNSSLSLGNNLEGLDQVRLANCPFLMFVALCLLLLSLCQCTAPADENDSISYLKAQVNGPGYAAHDAWTSRRRLPNHEALVQSAGDTFAYLESQHMLRELKNPCWKESSGVLKCMPYFQILGVSKCGTTDLYHRLSFNPDLADCGWKGPHFWDESVYPISAHRALDKRYNGSFPAYVSIFDKAAMRIQENPRRITGEASSNTFTGVYSFLRGTQWPR
jgi:N-acetylgalactosamine 4-sulfate 6-O-sulfotransferase